MKTFQLSSGSQVPVIGLGTWQMTDEEAANAVSLAIQMGYRHIDGAWIYLNEKGVGQGIADGINAAGINRDDLWVTSKLWNNCHQPEHVQPALEQTLNDLGLEYLDLYLIHWPIAHRHECVRPQNGSEFLSLEEVPLAETWTAMEACHAKGLCKNIGVSNFSVKKLKSLMEGCSTRPVMNQVESHPYFPQLELLEFCQQQNIQMTAYSPLGSAGRPDNLRQQDEPSLLNDAVIHEVAEKHGVANGQIVLAWAINRGTIPIPKSSNPDHMKQNLDAASIQLTAEDIAQIETINKNFRFLDGSFWEAPGGPYTVANLWDEI